MCYGQFIAVLLLHLFCYSWCWQWRARPEDRGWTSSTCFCPPPSGRCWLVTWISVAWMEYFSQGGKVWPCRRRSTSGGHVTRDTRHVTLSLCSNLSLSGHSAMSPSVPSLTLSSQPTRHHRSLSRVRQSSPRLRLSRKTGLQPHQVTKTFSLKSNRASTCQQENSQIST